MPAVASILKHVSLAWNGPKYSECNWQPCRHVFHSNTRCFKSWHACRCNCYALWKKKVLQDDRLALNIEYICSGQITAAGRLQLRQECRYHSWGINLALFLWLLSYSKSDVPSVCLQPAAYVLQHLMSCHSCCLIMHALFTFRVLLNPLILVSSKHVFVDGLFLSINILRLLIEFCYLIGLFVLK